jgi:hypothetical protein
VNDIISIFVFVPSKETENAVPHKYMYAICTAEEILLFLNTDVYQL